MARYRVDREGGLPHFVNCTIEGWLYVFSSPAYFDIIIQSLKYCREHKGILITAFVIMPNHLHVILLPLPGVNLENVMRDFKRHTSRKITEQLREDRRHQWLAWFERAARSRGDESQQYKVWQDGYHPEVIYTEDFYHQKSTYLHNNPVRKGFVAVPENWLYSSASFYVTGKSSVMDVDGLEW